MIARFNGNVVPFADDSTSTNRTVFGGVTQSDAIDDNLNADFKKGWEIVGLNDNPTREDFNAMGYTLGALTAYLYEMGISEWNASQNYRANSRVIGSDGNLYKSLTGTSGTPNAGNNPLSDVVNWKSLEAVTLTGNQTIAGIKTFSSNIIGSITGNSDTATKLGTARNINGVSFDGTANISVGLDSQSGLITSSFTLNNTHKNKLLVCSGTFTISLPNTALKSGDLFIMGNTGTGTISLAINGNNWDLTRASILPGETLIIQNDGSGASSFYRFVSRSKDFASNINATAGYTYLPNGVLMQWGYGIGINIPPNMGALDITFPITFPNGVFFSDIAVVDTGINKQISAPFCVATSVSNLHITNTDADSPITQIRWFSIGH